MSDGATENDVASQKTTEPQFKTEREVIDYFTTLSQEVNLARGKIGELGVSLREHVNVLQNVKDLDPSRRCFRSVGGVLVERTVKEVIPAVETNAANLQKIAKSARVVACSEASVDNQLSCSPCSPPAPSVATPTTSGCTDSPDLISQRRSRCTLSQGHVFARLGESGGSCCGSPHALRRG